MTRSRASKLNEKITQYSVTDDQFRISHETEKELPAGTYKVGEDMSGLYFNKVTTVGDEMLSITDARLDPIIEEVSGFWESADKYASLGLLHKRGVLLESPPGTGKSVLMRKLSEDAVAKGAVVLLTTHPRTLTAALKQIRAVESSRPVMCLLDDLDNMLHSESSLISLLDGEDTVGNVLFVGATNYIERFPPRLRRPGRFDTLLTVGQPPENVREAYFKSKMADADDAKIAELVRESKDFSFAKMKELLVSTQIFNRDASTESQRLRSGLLGESRADNILNLLNSKTVGAAVKTPVFQVELPGADTSKIKDTEFRSGDVVAVGKKEGNKIWIKAMKGAGGNFLVPATIVPKLKLG